MRRPAGREDEKNDHEEAESGNRLGHVRDVKHRNLLPFEPSADGLDNKVKADDRCYPKAGKGGDKDKELRRMHQTPSFRMKVPHGPSSGSKR